MLKTSKQKLKDNTIIINVNNNVYISERLTYKRQGKDYKDLLNNGLVIVIVYPKGINRGIAKKIICSSLLQCHTEL